MNSSHLIPYEYKIGGSLPLNTPTYVMRQADEDLFNHLKAGMFCYVLTSRQMGKSSLRVKTMNRLQESGMVCMAMDLTEIVELDITRNQFYKSITRHLAKSFNLLNQIDNFQDWWRDHEQSPMQGLSCFVEEVLLKYEPLQDKKLGVFIDEIDSVLRLPFSVNDFFALIRCWHNNRADNHEYDRLTFCILGVASPYDLIKDANHSPPFNFGKSIELTGFKLEEAEPIAVGLKEKFNNYKPVLKAILDWTGGQPFLTQKLCKLIVEAESVPPRGREKQWVEKLVRSRIIENWESQDEPEHLRTIRDRLLRQGPQNRQLLELYQQILKNAESTPDLNEALGAILAEETPEKMQLRLSGLVVKRNGNLRVTNRIYKSVFDALWTEKALASLPGSSPVPQSEDEEFFQTLVELERNLLVAQLAQVHDGNCSEQTLYEVLRNITLQIGNLLHADRATIYLLNEDKNELWSVVAENETSDFLDIQVRVGEGIAGQVAQTKALINIPDGVYQDPRSKFVKEFDTKYNYYTANILAVPVLNESGDLVAVIQLLNKLTSQVIHGFELNQTIDRKGFTEGDSQRLYTFLSSIARILESCQSCYKATQKLRATAALSEATRSLDQANLDTKEILQRVMNAAKKLLNADRSTLWLIDREREDLWTELPETGEKRCPIGVGFVGKVAETLQPMIIPFDLYEHPHAGTAKETDKQTGYRTSSLLCMPVLNPDGELLGVTQLLNKRKLGEFPEYNPSNWPEVPEQFKASFDENDRQSMQVFNQRVGVILQYAQTHEALLKIAEVKPKEVVHNALFMLSNVGNHQSEPFLYDALYNILNFLGRSLSKLVNAEGATIWVFNSELKEFWSLMPSGKMGDLVEEIIPDSPEIQKEIMAFHSRGEMKGGKAKRKSGMVGITNDQLSVNQGMVVPIAHPQGQVMALVHLIHPKAIESGHLIEQRTESILPIVEGCQSFYRDIKILEHNRENEKLWAAMISLSEKDCDLQEIRQEMLQKVLNAAQKMTNSDRSTLWLLDRHQGNLWTTIPGEGELRCQIGVGFVGIVAETCQSMLIPFDLYKHPKAANAKKTDKQTGYRTFSLLCTPVLGSDGKLLGVTQLVNKRKPGNFPPYQTRDKRKIPDYFKTSFNERDRRSMELFNAQVGVILQNIQQKDLIRYEIQNRLASKELQPTRS
ncbi:GAF domain-containing protein [Laspinema sp. A4]|uniref:GAF domain-containing protein n=1 Tax=Laspinema sp. D2d TaxID=2953686 RepID=UPI0021BB3AF5|nr:GAF domain-containing protein [Laspinema sp. D2d]MCT7983078.1 GAF domain-containing protein [Laspinema sp. D2d]